MTPGCMLLHVFRLRFFDEVTREGARSLLKLITHRSCLAVGLQVHPISGRECWCVDHWGLLICSDVRGVLEPVVFVCALVCVEIVPHICRVS